MKKHKKTPKIKPETESNPDRSPAVATVPLPEPERRKVPLALITPDPDQPRKTFDVVKLNELAESIRERGIVQDLALEFIPAPYRIIEPELHRKTWLLTSRGDGSADQKEFASGEELEQWVREKSFEPNLSDTYRIIFGERRWRAATIVGLTEVPAKVYTGLTSAQRFGMQHIENNQRENITALEEAAAIEKQLSQRQQADTNFTAEMLADELGISRAGIYERIKLNRLQPALREALLAGTISTSMAAVLAKLPTPKAQAAMLAEIEQKAKYGHPYSVREAQDLVDDECRPLSAAPFDPKLTYGDSNDLLNPCTDCPHRTGNMLALFPDLKSRPNVCTETGCYGRKVKAHWQAQAEARKLKGAEVLTEKEFKAARTLLVSPEEYIYPIGKNGEVGKLLGKHAPEAVLVATDTGLAEYFRKADLPEAFKAAKLKFREEDRRVNPPQTAEEKAAEALQRAKTVAAGEARERLVKSLYPDLAKALARLSQKESWAVAATLGEHASGWPTHDAEAALVKGEKDPRLIVLGRLFADEENQPLTSDNTWNDDNVKAWKTVGVDLLAAEKEAAKEAAQLPLEAKKDKQPELGGMPAKAAKKQKGKK